jgi:bifunctional aspartokinase / homoserine dehydrogenase 1
MSEPAGRTLIMKFGGTSVGSPAAMRQMAEIVRDARPDWPRLVVVVSALTGVTDLLLRQAAQAAAGNLEGLPEAVVELHRRHAEIIEALALPERQAGVKAEVGGLITEFETLCRAIGVLGEATLRALDAVASLGERMSVRVAAEAVLAIGLPAEVVEATRLIVTDDCFQSAAPDRAATALSTRQVLLPLLAAGKVPVTTGFIAATSKGVVTTLGRGGSDYSAALLGEALPADDVWIWTDVNGVMTTDPRLVPDARTIPELTFREISELAYFGAKVLHPKTIRPVIDAGVGLRVCNTFQPSHPGTRLVADDHAPRHGQVKAVTAIKGLQLITVEGRGMLGVPGVAARTFTAVAATGTSVPLITQASSEQSICFAVPVEATESVLARLQAVFAHEIANQDIDRVWATGEVVIITVVGAGMRSTPGISGKVFSALGNVGVNIIAIAQGSSEVAISLVVDGPSVKAAVQALHNLIINGRQAKL